MMILDTLFPLAIACAGLVSLWLIVRRQRKRSKMCFTREELERMQRDGLI